MTTHERKIAAAIDETKLDKLAEVVVKVGLKVQEGQDVFLDGAGYGACLRAAHRRTRL